MMVYEMTVQIRVPEFNSGKEWYVKFLEREPNFVPHEGFAEWELMPGSWLQLAEGVPAPGSGPLRLGVLNLEAERTRLMDVLGLPFFEIEGRDEVPVRWATFHDPWGNRLGLFEYREEADQQEQVHAVRPADGTSLAGSKGVC